MPAPDRVTLMGKFEGYKSSRRLVQLANSQILPESLEMPVDEVTDRTGR
jgi:hypothetical protein